MDKFILINLNMFTTHNNLFIINEQGMDHVGSFTMEQMPAVLAQMSEQSGITEVRIAGNADFASTLVEDIKTYEMKHYAENKMNVEVIR